MLTKYFVCGSITALVLNLVLMSAGSRFETVFASFPPILIVSQMILNQMVIIYSHNYHVCCTGDIALCDSRLCMDGTGKMKLRSAEKIGCERPG